MDEVTKQEIKEDSLMTVNIIQSQYSSPKLFQFVIIVPNYYYQCLSESNSISNVKFQGSFGSKRANLFTGLL